MRLQRAAAAAPGGARSVDNRIPAHDTVTTMANTPMTLAARAPAATGVRGAPQVPRSWRRWLPALLCVHAMACPAPAAAQDVDARLERLRAHLASCTAEHGYDPARSGNVGEHELAPGEAAWRGCAYQGVREIMVPGSAVPDAYEALIALDRVITRDVEAGKSTRDDRRARIRTMVDDIVAREKTAAGGSGAASTDEEMSKMRDEFMARQEEIKRMRRFQQMMR